MSYPDLANTSPYYDDFDGSKNYFRVLFNPGRAVQARELTQLQTMLQAQTTSFANHMFKENSPIINAKIEVSATKPYFKVNANTDGTLEAGIIAVDLSNFLGKEIIGQTSGSRGLVTHIDQAKGHIYYTYGGAPFTDGEVFYTDEAAQFECTMTPGTQAIATMASCDAGIIYTAGHFVIVNSQEIIVDDGINGHYHLGFRRQESISTTGEDPTLADPANGSYNFNAPGADRYKIDLVLASYVDGDTLDPTFESEFTEYMVVDNGKVVLSQTEPQYGPILDLLARRTYDESGDYVVKDFNLQVEDSEAEPDKLYAYLQPGKAYIRGYEQEKVLTELVKVDKARDTESKQQHNIFAFGGQYTKAQYDDATNTFVSNGVLDVDSLEILEVMSNASGGGTILGEVRLMNMKRIGDELLLYIADTGGVSSVFSSGKSMRSKATPGNWINLHLENGLSVLEGQPRSPIFDLGYEVIKTLAANQSQFEYLKLYTGQTLTSNSVTINAPDITTDWFGNDGIMFAYDVTGGSVLPVGDISAVVNNAASPSTITLDFSGVAGVGASDVVDIVLKLKKNSANELSKSLSAVVYESFTVPAGTDVVQLAQEDVFEIVSVTQDTNVGTALPADAYEHLRLDSGARDHYYDKGEVSNLASPWWDTYKSNTSADTQYTIGYRYFSHTGSGAYFTVDSYMTSGNLAIYSDMFDRIPTYQTEDAQEVYDLINSFDFRRKLSDLSSGVEVVYPDSFITCDVEYYLGRIDELYINTEGQFGIAKGISSRYPEQPLPVENSLTLYSLYLPPYTFGDQTVHIKARDNRRYTMRDIGELEQRIENLETYSSMSMLETSVKDLAVVDANGFDKFKSGILVDSFTDHNIGNIEDPEYRVVMDAGKGEARCPFNKFMYDLEHKDNAATMLSKNIRFHDNIATMDYTEEVMAENKKASGSINLNPFLFVQWNGTVKLSPAVDYWVDTVNLPVVRNTVGSSEIPANNGVVNWNDWQTEWVGIRIEQPTTARPTRPSGPERPAAPIVRPPPPQSGSGTHTAYPGVRPRIPVDSGEDGQTRPIVTVPRPVPQPPKGTSTPKYTTSGGGGRNRFDPRISFNLR